MLRLFVFSEPSVVTIRAEGELSCATVDRVERLVGEHLKDERRRVVLNFGDMTLADNCAAKYVQSVFEGRARVLAISSQAEERLRGRAAEDCRSRCNRVQRMLFAEVRHLHALPERVRKVLCKFLSTVLPRRVLEAAEFLCVDARR